MGDFLNINFLWKASCLFEPTSHSNQLLKSHLLTICKDTPKTDFDLPKAQFGVNSMCQKCCTCWFDGKYEISTVSKKTNSTKAKKLIQALNSGEKLTRKQKIRAKWFQKRSKSYIQITCLVCKNITKMNLHKPNKKIECIKTEEIPIKKSKIKKTKKKDQFAGLNSKVFQSLSVKKNVPKNQNLDRSSQQNSVQKKLSNSSINIKKGKNKLIVKPQSNIKQNNKLVQLAQLLKRSEANQRTGANDRLKNLLR